MQSLTLSKQAIAEDVEKTFTDSMCEDVLQNLCASVGGRPRCQVLLLFDAPPIVARISGS
jgi:hypothetical protein